MIYHSWLTARANLIPIARKSNSTAPAHDRQRIKSFLTRRNHRVNCNDRTILVSLLPTLAGGAGTGLARRTPSTICPSSASSPDERVTRASRTRPLGSMVRVTNKLRPVPAPKPITRRLMWIDTNCRHWSSGLLSVVSSNLFIFRIRFSSSTALGRFDEVSWASATWIASAIPQAALNQRGHARVFICGSSEQKIWDTSSAS